MSDYKCPHCGWTYDPAVSGHGLVPWHQVRNDDPGSEHVVDRAKGIARPCPGYQQVPRNAESDRRPLWSEEKPPRCLYCSKVLDFTPSSPLYFYCEPCQKREDMRPYMEFCW